jgi:hypothetical protein
MKDNRPAPMESNAPEKRGHRQLRAKRRGAQPSRAAAVAADRRKHAALTSLSLPSPPTPTNPQVRQSPSPPRARNNNNNQNKQSNQTTNALLPEALLDANHPNSRPVSAAAQMTRAGAAPCSMLPAPAPSSLSPPPSPSLSTTLPCRPSPGRRGGEVGEGRGQGGEREGGRYGAGWRRGGRGPGPARP